MKIKGYVYAFYAALLIPGLLLGFYMKTCHGLVLSPPLLPLPGVKVTLTATLFLYCTLMRLPLLLFASGFTVFAPLVSGGAVLYLGMLVGSGALMAIPASIRIPILLLLALLLSLALVLCGQASFHRLTLRRTAPGLRALLHSRATRAYLSGFLAHCAVSLGAAALILWLFSIS